MLHKAIPLLRMFDLAKAEEFYVDWQHRFDENAPVYRQISKDNLTLHLTEPEILENLARSVLVEEARFLDHSLTLVRLQPSFAFYYKLAGRREKDQLRVKFWLRTRFLRSIRHGPGFLGSVPRLNQTCLDDTTDAYLCVSLARITSW